MPLSLLGSFETRPYFLVGELEKRSKDLDSYFYERLIETIEKGAEDARLTRRELANSALLFGSTSLDICLHERRCEANRGPEDIFEGTETGLGVVASRAARRLGMKGPILTFSTACTSSANALLYAASLLRASWIERAVVVGYDLFNATSLYGFEALQLIAPDPGSPSDARRGGMVQGEGCGVLIVDRNRRRGSRCALVAGANACDTFNVTTNTPDGSVMARVISDALEASGVRSGEIVAIKAHATGSETNDVSEARAMRAVFGASMPPVTGLKPHIGHTFGACGTVETAILAACLELGFVPAMPGFRDADEETHIEPLAEHVSAREGPYLLNFFGFGGNCASLVLRLEA